MRELMQLLCIKGNKGINGALISIGGCVVSYTNDLKQFENVKEDSLRIVIKHFVFQIDYNSYSNPILFNELCCIFTSFWF